jgi:hypothetical protein
LRPERCNSYFDNFDKNYRNLLGKQLKASYILHNPDKPLPKFSLLDHNRQLFDNERLRKGWLLLLFIYTHCPDVCPTELLDMSQLKMGNVFIQNLRCISKWVKSDCHDSWHMCCFVFCHQVYMIKKASQLL